MCQWLTAGRLHLIKDKVWKKSITSATQIFLIFTLSLLIISIPGRAAEYGEINVTTANDETWSTLLSNNVSKVAGNIIVNDGAVLAVENATIQMDRYYSGSWKYPSIIVCKNGTLNVNGSTVTRYDSDSKYYGWRYESGSMGNLSNATVSFCIYNSGFKIETNETVTLSNVTLDHGDESHPSGDCYGIYLNGAANASLRDCTIKTSSTSSSATYRYSYAIRLSNSDNNTFENITVPLKGCYYHAIHIDNSDNNAFSNVSITRGTYSSASYDAVRIESSTGNSLDGLSIAGSSNNYGIYLSSADANTITNSTIVDSVSGSVYITSSGNNTLRDTDLNSSGRNLYVTGNYENDIDTSNRVNGGLVYYRHDNSSFEIAGKDIGHVTLYNCSDASISDNTFVVNGDGIRILSSTANITINNNTFQSNNYYGALLSSSRANITNNTITNTDITAVSLTSSHSSNITNNTVSSSGSSDDNAAGIRLSGSTNNNLIENNITGTGTDGVGIELLSSSNSNNLRDNIITYSGGTYGILLSASSGNDLINNTAKNKDVDGLHLTSNSNYTRVQYNNFSDNSYGGVTIDDGSHNTLTGNTVLSNDGGTAYTPRSGVTILSGTNNSIVGNILSYNSRNGIRVDSAGNRISDNTIVNNSDNGIWIDTDDNTFSNNSITINSGTGYGFYIDFGEYDNYIYQNNTVNGESIYYYYCNSSETVTVEPLTVARVSNVGKITLIKCYDFEITGNTLTNNSYIDGVASSSGIFLYNSSNVTISNNTIEGNYLGVYLYNSSNNTINDTNQINTSENSGLYLNLSDYNNITDNNLALNVINGILLKDSDHNNLACNSVTGSPDGINFTTSLYNNISTCNITNYSSAAIRLIEYSLNNTLINNSHSRGSGAEFDICINDSNYTIIAPNETTAENYTFYLTGDTRLCTLDTVFNKTDVGYEDTSNLTLMWRIDVLSWDNKHVEPIWGNLTVRYGDYSDVGGILIWNGTVSNLNGRLSNNPTEYWGPPTSTDNWLPVIEYKENATGRVDYQSAPMNCTVINQWDRLQGRDTSYRNITVRVREPGVTIIVNAGYTPNGRCYYCHEEKLTFTDMIHWTKYTENLTDMSDPYTPGRCIDCHDENDSATIPHGTASGNDMLHQHSPGLCYSGTSNLSCHSANATQSRLQQETQFNQTTHHPLGEGQLGCISCHDNHGTGLRYDLLRTYTNATQKTYDSYDYSLCFTCHLEEKLKAKMTGETNSHLQNYTNQTNFRDEYWWKTGFGDGTPNPYNIHRGHYYTCYCCHNPHGTDYVAITRPNLAYVYITNLTPPSDEYPSGVYEYQEVLDEANWSNPEMNQGGGLSSPTCGGCHRGARLPSRFIYREYIDYEPAGGAGCVECHDSGRPDAIRPIVNVSAMKIAMHENLSQWAEDGADLAGTDKNFTEWLEYRNYTASEIANISTDNALCWSCHSTNGTPPNPTFHSDRALLPYRCAKCHGPEAGQPPHTRGRVKAIDNHGPTTKGAGSIYIQTDVGTNGSCEDCHYPSRLPESMIGTLQVWKYTSGGWTAYTGRTHNGDVSHYGLNRSQGVNLGIENPLVDTSNCLYCHTNSTQGAIWGNAPNVTDNMYGANTSNLSECYTYCHVLPDYLGNITEETIPHFHNISIYSGGGPDCVECHDVDSPYGVQSLVNSTSISQGIHGNVTNNTIEIIPDIDPRSKPCWGCHTSDGSEPEGMGDRNWVYLPHKRPWSCEDCHTRTSEWVAATGNGESWIASSYPPNRLPPRIYAHHPNSTTVKTNVDGPGRCVDCHANSIDPHSNDTEAKILGNTIFSNVSHYGTKTDLITPTEDCAICHNSTGNSTKWGGAPQNTHGNFDNYSAPDGCYCHTNDHHTPADFHAESLTAGEGGFDCLRCHNSTGFADIRRINGSIFAESIHHLVNNASTMEYSLNRSCWACHFDNGTSADNHSTRRERPYLCHDCHNSNNTTLFSNVSDAPEVHNHFKNGTVVEAYWTKPTDSESCMGCHSKSEMLYYYIPDENETTPYYTNFSIVSHYGDNRSDLVALYDPSDSTDYCSYCHKNTSTVFMEYENDKNIVHDRGRGCNKNNCHGDGRLHENTLTRPKTSSKCLSCHELLPSDVQNRSAYKINLTAMNLGVHRDVNINMSSVAGGGGEGSNANNSKCWGCHVIGGVEPVNGHQDTINNGAYLCYDCHNGTVAYQNVSNATAVYNHFKSGVNISACTTAETNSESCGYGCHNLTTMKVPDYDAGETASYRVNLSQASHYARSRPEIAIQSNLSDCTWCHRNLSNEFIEIFERSGSPNCTEKIPHATQTAACTIPECHNSGRIHDQNLKIPEITWREECESCHFGLNDSAMNEYYVNETMLSESVHHSVNCTDCHIHRREPVQWHPIEEYYWKWCECCHSYQSDFLNETSRHDVTDAPGESILSSTNCTVCHDETGYYNATRYYNSSAEHECRWCHILPDRIFPEGVSV